MGQLLATGLCNDEIIAELEKGGCTHEDAVFTLRSVYDIWQVTLDTLKVQDTDLVNWHVKLRMKLLQASLKDNSAPGIRTCLSILDSLAQVQGVCGNTLTLSKPISLTLVPTKEKEILPPSAMGVSPGDAPIIYHEF